MSNPTTFETQSKSAHSDPHLRCWAGHLTQAISYLALFIIAIAAAAGAMPPSTAGWLAVGFGGAALIGNLSVGGLKDRKCMVIFGTLTAASIILVGAFGVAGLGALTTTKSIGITLLILTLTNTTYCASCCDLVLNGIQESRQDD
ncbi:MAG: hypothetical protein JJU12_05890 [Chlamydiales bacterium]|nr:hypothetical protein [Chlamydiales bacterium]